MKSFAYCKKTVDENVPSDGKAMQISRLGTGSSDSVLLYWGKWSVQPPLISTLERKKKKNPCTLLMRTHGVHLINVSFMTLPQPYFFLCLRLLWFFRIHILSPHQSPRRCFSTLLWKLCAVHLWLCRGRWSRLSLRWFWIYRVYW